MGSGRHLAERTSKRLTKEVAVRWGERFPFYYVSEYPKSGGTWLARMVSDYLQIPYPQHTMLPVGFSCVIRNEWSYHPGLRRAFYLYRDGRDVMVSFFFHRLQVARYSGSAAAGRTERVYRKVLGDAASADDIIKLLPRFIEFEFEKPGRGPSTNWRDHISDWYDPEARPDVAFLSYEDLLGDTAATLGRAIGHVTGEVVDDWRLATTIEKFSMKRLTGRAAGQEDLTHAIRKGISGDWRNHFSRESAELFNHLAGDTLIRLGYEHSLSWVDDYDYVAQE